MRFELGRIDAEDIAVKILIPLLLITVQGLPAQTTVWTRQFGTAGYDIVQAVASSVNGAFVVGLTSGSLEGSNQGVSCTTQCTADAFVRKYNSDGSVAWTRQFGTAYWDVATSVAADATAVYVGGYTELALEGNNAGWTARPPVNAADAFVRKYDGDGNVIWTRQFGTVPGDSVTAIAVDDTGIYVAGYTEGSLEETNAGGQLPVGSPNARDVFVRKVSFDGNTVWTRQFGTSSSDYATRVTVRDGAVFVAGRTEGALDGTSLGSGDIFVRKFTTDGAVLWTRQFGTAHEDLAGGIAVDSSGVYVSGALGGILDVTSSRERSGFVRKYSSDGFVLWTRQFGNPGADATYSAATDAFALYIGGVDNNDASLRAYTPDGTLAWTRQFGTIATEVSTGIAVDATGVYVAGYTEGALAGANAGATDGFVRKYSRTSIPTSTIITGVSPSPATAGQPYTVSVRVTSPPEIPDGQVLVSDGGAQCSMRLEFGSGSCSLTSPSSGVRTITATYSGDGSYTPSSASTIQPVQAIAPTLLSTTISILSISPAPSSVGQPYIINFRVSSAAGQPTGEVVVSDGTSLTSCPVAGVPCMLTSNSEGSKTITARYLGNAVFSASFANGTQVVQGSRLQFVPLTPCRVLETRPTYNTEGRSGVFGPPQLSALEVRTLNLPSSSNCQIPTSAKAYVLNVTLLPRVQGLNLASLWPTGETRPTTWTVVSDGQVVANSAVVKAGAGGGINVFVSDAADLLIDISGYYTEQTGLLFFPLTPCRVIDTRVTYRPLAGPFGPPSLRAQEVRRFRLPQTPYCAVPTAAAYSVTVTVVPPAPLAFLTAWPAGVGQPAVSTINSFAGRVLANNVVVPAAPDGSIDLFGYNDTDVLVDINGYYAPDDGRNGLYYFAVTQCRASDSTAGAPFANETARTVDVPAAVGCQGIPRSAKAYALNVIALPNGNPMPFITAYPTGQPRPAASILNAFEGQAVANAAIVPSGANGAVDIYAFRATHVIVEATGYFGR
ncbi:MAG: Ig-like domain repeat protein [Bryobacterales bacterium]|nr:Ig-like domain repeat protein [Bryobacterales bacterium]